MGDRRPQGHVTETRSSMTSSTPCRGRSRRRRVMEHLLDARTRTRRLQDPRRGGLAGPADRGAVARSGAAREAVSCDGLDHGGRRWVERRREEPARRLRHSFALTARPGRGDQGRHQGRRAAVELRSVDGAHRARGGALARLWAGFELVIEQAGGHPVRSGRDLRRFGDVCKIDGSRLGVCAQKRSGSGFSCASQH